MKILLTFVAGLLFLAPLSAEALSVGGSAGVEFPFHHPEYEAGVAAEAFWRKDQYELRFHYANTKSEIYSLVAGMKHFFSNESLRPYVEAAVGPVIVDTHGRDLAYGVKPEFSLGADLGLSRHLSFGMVTRYYGMIYFGDTGSGNFEANQGLNMLLNVILWF
jgi:hypothetical protein